LGSVVIAALGTAIQEEGRAEQVFDSPQAPYTKALMAAAFELEAVEGGVVST
jgi:microcin C transport system ATP-binding protein